MNQNEQMQQPFFARFMEVQNRQTTNEGQGLNRTEASYDEATTLKFPSDRDEEDWGF